MTTTSWDIVQLGDVVEDVTVGYVGTMASEYVPAGIPFLRSKNVLPYQITYDDIRYISPAFHERIKKSALAPGDVVIVRTGKPGTTAVVPDSLPVANCSDLVIVRPGPKVNSRFLAYYFNVVATHHVDSHLVGAVQQHFNVESARRLRLPVPPRKEQDRIAHIAGTLDDKIELNRRMNETLEAMARALFKSWFVDFDPVHAKAAVLRDHPKWTNAQVSRAALPNLAPAVAELFPDSFEDSALGPIPAAWRVARIDGVATINGWTLGKKDPLDWIDYIEISEVMRGDIGAIPRYRRGEEPSRARRRLRHGDTVLSTVRPDRGAYFLSLNPPETLVASTGFAVVTPTSVPWPWLACALTSHDVSEYLGHQADGGAYPAVNPSVIGAVQYAVPDDAMLLEHFASLSAPWLTRAQENRNQAKQLAVTRDSLLPRLLSGELLPRHEQGTLKET